jgi:glycosyltransferase involved in cell wall biosynthesis
MCVETNQKGFHKIEYLGGMDQCALVPWYQRATVLARPDLVGASGEGCSTMEALACGTPVIGIQNHVIRNGVNGLIVEPNNPGELAEALNKILEDKELRKSYGNAGRKIIEQHFSLKSAVRELTKMYEDVINENSNNASSTRMD